MVMHKDYKAYVTLGLLVVGLVFSILALSTNHWSRMNMDMGLGKMKANIGLWRSCVSVEVLSISQSKCFDNGHEGSDLAALGDMNSENSDLDSLFSGVSNDNKNDFLDNGKRRKRNSDSWNSDDEDNYNDLKIMRMLECSALLGSIASIVAWMAYLILTAKQGPTMHGTQRAMKILAIVCTPSTAAAHLLAVILWVVENEVQHSSIGFFSLGGGLSYGWSFAIAVSASGVHLLTVVPMVLTKHKKLNDRMEHSMTPTYNQFA